MKRWSELSQLLKVDPRIAHIDPLWASWFSGFIDGEGYFQLMPGSSGFRPALVIDLRADDQAVSIEIQGKLGVGKIYHISKEYDRKKGRNSSDQYRWRCIKTDHVVNVLIPLFDTYQLKSKKKNDYRIWRAASLLIASGGNSFAAEYLNELKKMLVKQRRIGLENIDIEVLLFVETKLGK